MLLSVIETAETLGCSAQYVRKLLREGRLAGQKIGDSWILNDDTLESFDRKDLRMKKMTFRIGNPRKRQNRTR